MRSINVRYLLTYKALHSFSATAELLVGISISISIVMFVVAAVVVLERSKHGRQQSR